MAHLVTCQICKKKFDRDLIPTTKYSERRYCHASCYPQGELVLADIKIDPEEQDRKDLCAYIVNRHGLKATGPFINSQIKKFHDEAGYTYSGMKKALQYWYDIKGNYDPAFKDTVAIIGAVYHQARNYFYNLYVAQQLNIDKNINDYKSEEKIVTIPQPQPRQPRKRRLFDLGED